MANSTDPDQAAPLGAVLSRSALLAKIYPSKYMYIEVIFPSVCVELPDYVYRKNSKNWDT